MRWAASQQLRQHGYSERDVADALDVRRTYEAALRGNASAARAQHALDDVAQKPWGELAGLPPCFRGPGTWPDMDFDPVPVYERINCPVLAVWGEADPWIPVDVSEAALRRAVGDRLTVLRLPATGHGPDVTDRRYEVALAAHVLRALQVRGDH
jgi:pimeloyl-ACP methyl ester carboxylesterase